MNYFQMEPLDTLPYGGGPRLAQYPMEIPLSTTTNSIPEDLLESASLNRNPELLGCIRIRRNNHRSESNHLFLTRSYQLGPKKLLFLVTHGRTHRRNFFKLRDILGYRVQLHRLSFLRKRKHLPSHLNHRQRGLQHKQTCIHISANNKALHCLSLTDRLRLRGIQYLA